MLYQSQINPSQCHNQTNGLSLYVSKSVWGTSLALNFKVALSESLGKDENKEQPGQKDKSKYVQMSIVQCEGC